MHPLPIGPAIRRLRRKRSMRQYQLELSAGIGQGTLSAIEHGNPISLASLCKVAAALGVDASELLRRAERLQQRTTPTHRKPAAQETADGLRFRLRA